MASTPGTPAAVINSVATSNKNLWEEAFDLLRQKDRVWVKSKKCEDTTKLLQLVEEFQKTSGDRHLKATRSNGDILIFREIFAKLTRWMQKIVHIGDIAVQFDAGHAVLPWAMLRFILQTCINDEENRTLLLEGIEEIVQTITKSTIQERLYLSQSCEATELLKKQIISLYASILEFLAKAVRYYEGSSASRIKKSVSFSGAKFKTLLSTIKEKRIEVERASSLVAEETNADVHRKIQGSQQVLLQELHDLETSITRVDSLTTKLYNLSEEHERDKILDRISDIKYAIYHDIIDMEVYPNAGRWLLDDNTFMSWQNSSACQLFWLHGIPGSGKTALTSIVIQKLIENSGSHLIRPIYFFCARDPAEPYRSDASKIMRSLLGQLVFLGAPKAVLDTIKQRFRNRHDRLDIPIWETEDLLLQIIQERPATFIVIDALDECSREQKRVLLNSLLKLLRSSSSLLKLFVSSKEDQDIVMRLRNHPNKAIAENNEEDIRSFVHREIEARVEETSLLPTIEVSETFKEEIKDTLCSHAKSMFRWAYLQLQFLCTLNTIDEVRNRLTLMPPSIHESYEDNYSREIASLTSNDKTITEAVFSLLLCSGRPLAPAELGSLVPLCTEAHHSNSKLTDGQILKFTANLVVLKENVFRFAHLSVREFLEFKDQYSNDINNEKAAIACLATLLQNPDLPKIDYDYASFFWSAHCVAAKSNRCNSRLASLLFKFMLEDEAAFTSWWKYLNRASKNGFAYQMPDYQNRMRQSCPELCCPLFAACKLGFTEIVELWISRKKPITPLEPRYLMGPLSIASRYGFYDIVTLLCATSAYTDSQIGSLNDALKEAVKEGHEDIVHLLLEEGARVEASMGASYNNLLCVASSQGNNAITKLLFDAGADLNVFDQSFNGTPLQISIQRGHKHLVEYLLDNGAEIGMEANCRHNNALGTAYRIQNKEIFLLLLDKAGKIDMNKDFWISALCMAAELGYNDIVESLLQEGPNMRDTGKKSASTAIISASHGGHKDLIQLMLDRGADVNVLDDAGSALRSAAFGGFKDIVDMLLDKGANANLMSNAGSPLKEASAKGNLEIVQILLAKGADVNLLAPRYKEGSSALEMASAGGYTEIVELLLDHGANPNFIGPDGSALFLASEHGHKEVIKLLLDFGAEIDEFRHRGSQCGTAIEEAARRGNMEIIRLLLDRGADINAGEALREARQNDHEEIYQFLLDNGAAPLWTEDSAFREYKRQISSGENKVQCHTQ